ncbi:MAG: ABC transporter permease [Thaumarchaeota archaeon]|nr:ABC transporter permease [Nitrososphaerota archaeon]
MRLIIVKRKITSPRQAYLYTLLSLLLGIAVYLVIVALSGGDPLNVAVNIAKSFISPSIVKDFFILTAIGCALLISFRAALWNIGGEGQFYMAMLPGVFLTLFAFNPQYSQAPPPLVVLLAITLGSVMGALWALLAALFRAYLGVDETPVTLVLNYIAYYTINYLVYGPLKGRYTYGYLRTDEIPEVYRLNIRVHTTPRGTPLEAGLQHLIVQLAYYIALLVLAVLIYVFTWWFFKYSRLGLYIKIHGSNPGYLQAQGVNTKHVSLLAMAISGALIGLTGSVYLLTELGRIPYELERQTAGYGYLAVLVAWLSLLDLKMIPISAYVVSSLRNAGIAVQVAGLGGVEQTYLLIGSILLTYSVMRFLADYEVRVAWK